MYKWIVIVTLIFTAQISSARCAISDAKRLALDVINAVARTNALSRYRGPMTFKELAQPDVHSGGGELVYSFSDFTSNLKYSVIVESNNNPSSEKCFFSLQNMVIGDSFAGRDD